jgi:hypothetical protein
MTDPQTEVVYHTLTSAIYLQVFMGYRTGHEVVPIHNHTLFGSLTRLLPGKLPNLQ